MAGTSAASIISECRISASQEEVLANLRGGWERGLHFSSDDTPSQNLGFQSPRPPLSYEGEDGSESSDASESVDGEGDLGFTQEPVDWISPSSSPQANVGAEGNDDGVAKEDSSVAALDSDLSQSPSQDWHGQMEQPDPQPNLGVSAEFLTQPALGLSAEFLTQPAVGIMDFQYTSSEDVDDQILRRETIPEAEFLPFRKRSLTLLSPIPEISAIEAPALVAESCIQPFTQAFETQLPEPRNHTQEPVEQVQLIEERNEIHHPAVLDNDRPGTEELEPTQQGRGGDELIEDAPALNNDEFEMTGVQTSQGRGGDELLPSDSRLPADDTRQLSSTEHKKQLEHESSSEIPLVDAHNVSGLSEKAHPEVECVTERIPSNAEQLQRGDGDTSSGLKRVNGAEELHGQEKRQRAEVSPASAQSVTKRVMDVVRSRSRSLSDPLVGDERSLLSIFMRAGVSFPPLVYKKRSV